jgi:hypothetical protein
MVVMNLVHPPARTDHSIARTLAILLQFYHHLESMMASAIAAMDLMNINLVLAAILAKKWVLLLEKKL